MADVACAPGLDFLNGLKSMNPGVIKLSSPQTKEFWEIEVLYEDEDLLALNKPAGLLTSPDRSDPKQPNLMRLLHRDIERQVGWSRQRGLNYLANVHRLDFESSGILLLARNKPSLVFLANQFGAEKPEKVYVALVRGTPPDSFETDAKLAPHPVNVGMMRVDSRQGKKSLTRFKTLERFQGFARVECRPATGRTHQIRVHLQTKGYPVLGDSLYGGPQLLLSSLKQAYRLKHGREERPLIARVALHMTQLGIVHPKTGEIVRIDSPLPKDFTVALKYLRRYSSTAAVSAHDKRDQAESDDSRETDQENSADS